MFEEQGVLVHVGCRFALRIHEWPWLSCQFFQMIHAQKNCGKLVNCLVPDVQKVSEQERGHHFCMACSCTAVGTWTGYPN